MATPATNEPTQSDMLEKARDASANLECAFHHRPFDITVQKSFMYRENGLHWDLAMGVAVKCPLCGLHGVRTHPATVAHTTIVTTARKEQGAHSALLAETENNLLQLAATKYNIELVESASYADA